MVNVLNMFLKYTVYVCVYESVCEYMCACMVLNYILSAESKIVVCTVVVL